MNSQLVSIEVDGSSWDDILRSICHATRGRIITLQGSGESLRGTTDRLLANGGLYYPVVGWKDFRVPCFVQHDARLALSPLTPWSALEASGYLGPEYGARNNEWTEADYAIATAGVTDSPIVIDIIARPSAEEMIFLRRLVSLALSRGLRVIYIRHLAGPFRPNVQKPEEAALLALFLCGGRVLRSDWELVPGSSMVSHERLAYRNEWVMYASPEVGMKSRQLFECSDFHLRQKIADTLQDLFPGTWYLVGLGRVAEPRDTLEQPILMPHLWKHGDNALRYLQKMRHRSVLRGGQNDVLVRINEICLQINRALKEGHEHSAIRLVRLLERVACDVPGDQLWFGLAQLLSLVGKERSWNMAMSLYSRVEHLVEAKSEDPQTTNSRMAAIDNGRALVLVKQGNFKEAQRAEERAVARLGESPDDLQLRTQLVLLTCHHADLFVRHDVSSAASRYRQAWALTFAPGIAPAAMFYAGIRLGKALVRMGQFDEAEQTLKRLVEQCSGLTERDKLTAYLLRAEVLGRLGRPRASAFHYWKVFRHAYTVPAEGLIRILANITLIRRRLPSRVLGRAKTLIAKRAAAEADTKLWSTSIIQTWGN